MTTISSINNVSSYEELKNKVVVRVPIIKVLSFPNTCVMCGKNEPNSILTVKHILYYSKVSMLGLCSEKENFPVHKNCAAAIKYRQIALLCIFLLILWLLIYFIPNFYPSETTLLFMFPIILGYAIRNVIFPPPVLLGTAKGKKIFTFKNKAYGKSFANINDLL